MKSEILSSIGNICGGGFILGGRGIQAVGRAAHVVGDALESAGEATERYGEGVKEKFASAAEEAAFDAKVKELTAHQKKVAKRLDEIEAERKDKNALTRVLDIEEAQLQAAADELEGVLAKLGPAKAAQKEEDKHPGAVPVPA